MTEFNLFTNSGGKAHYKPYTPYLYHMIYKNLPKEMAVLLLYCYCYKNNISSFFLLCILIYNTSNYLENI